MKRGAQRQDNYAENFQSAVFPASVGWQIFQKAPAGRLTGGGESLLLLLAAGSFPRSFSSFQHRRRRRLPERTEPLRTNERTNWERDSIRCVAVCNHNEGYFTRIGDFVLHARVNLRFVLIPVRIYPVRTWVWLLWLRIARFAESSGLTRSFASGIRQLTYGTNSQFKAAHRLR